MRYALAIALFAIAASGQEPPRKSQEESVTLSFGVYQSDKATVMYRKFIPVLECLQTRLAAELGRPVDVHLRIYKTYDDAIDALVAGSVDFVRFGPASYIIAKKRNPEVSLLAMEQENGQKRFKGFVVVAANSPITALADLRGRSFAFGDPNSTIGRYLVQAELAKAGVHSSDLKSFKYLDRHDKVAKAVELGDFDAGSIKVETYNAMPEGTLRVIASFDNVTKPWAARAGLDESASAAIRKCLLGLDDRDVLKELGVSGFLPTDDSEYQIVKEGMEKATAFEKQ